MSKCSWDSGSRPRFERSGSRGRASFVPAAWGRVPPSLHTRPRGTTVRAKGNNLRIEVDGRGKLSCGVGQTRLRVGTMFPPLEGRRLHALPAIRSNSPRRRPLSTRHDNWWHATTFGGVMSGYQTSAQAGYLKTIRMRVGRGTSWPLTMTRLWWAVYASYPTTQRRHRLCRSLRTAGTFVRQGGTGSVLSGWRTVMRSRLL